MNLQDFENEIRHQQYISGFECGDLYSKGLVDTQELLSLLDQDHAKEWRKGFKEGSGVSLDDLSQKVPKDSLDAPLEGDRPKMSVTIEGKEISKAYRLGKKGIEEVNLLGGIYERYYILIQIPSEPTRKYPEGDERYVKLDTLYLDREGYQQFISSNYWKRQEIKLTLKSLNDYINPPLWMQKAEEKERV